MASSLVQFRCEEESRIKASIICEQLGIDLPTYMRMSLNRLIRENGIPFSMKLNESSENKGISALEKANLIAEEQGISDMTLDEINAEIENSRK
ncbi:MAG: type II toxin-antitoxin system RelB/DinJ family antitoxin [Oscillospiraceae bacterium]|nr:type II toxin-antitoxin system RelB/DinJ family antitoxin [Oscillospiraceae bacterium]